jgi:hypothetical protein
MTDVRSSVRFTESYRELSADKLLPALGRMRKWGGREKSTAF